jgi:hypothetical protein
MCSLGSCTMFCGCAVCGREAAGATVPVLVGVWPRMAEGRPAGRQKVRSSFLLKGMSNCRSGVQAVPV